MLPSWPVLQIGQGGTGKIMGVQGSVEMGRGVTRREEVQVPPRKKLEWRGDRSESSRISCKSARNDCNFVREVL